MQKTVESVKSETKEELKSEQIQGFENQARFNVTDVSGRYSGNPELWAIRYYNVYGNLFDVVDTLLQTPLDRKDASEKDVYNNMASGIDTLIDSASKNSDIDTQPLYNIRERVKEFKESEEDEMTLIITVHGPNSTIEYLNNYFNNGIVTVNLDGNPSISEKSTLSEYEESLMKKFCYISPYQKRPNKRFKRELHISMRKKDGETEATIDLQTNRVQYKIMERIFLKFGLSSPYKDEPIKDIN